MRNQSKSWDYCDKEDLSKQIVDSERLQRGLRMKDEQSGLSGIGVN